MKKEGLAQALAERLELPAEAVPGSAKLSVVGGRCALIENHRGILAYSPEQIVVSTGRGRICLNGAELRLSAMNRDELLIQGKLQSVEWE